MGLPPCRWDAFDFAASPAKGAPEVPKVPVDATIVDGCKKLWGE